MLIKEMSVKQQDQLLDFDCPAEKNVYSDVRPDGINVSCTGCIFDTAEAAAKKLCITAYPDVFPDFNVPDEICVQLKILPKKEKSIANDGKEVTGGN